VDEPGAQQVTPVSEDHPFGDVITAADQGDSYERKTGRLHPSKLLDWID
jgi:hypothetical protein